MALVKVTPKNSKQIKVLPQEVAGLKEAGLLKESKAKSGTKEEKKVGKTKDNKSDSGDGGDSVDGEFIGAGKTIKRRSAGWYPGPGETEEPPPLPVNISSANIHGGNPKKVK